MVHRDGPSGGADFWVKQPCTNAKPELAIRYHEFGRPKPRKQTQSGSKKASKVEPARPPTFHQKAAAVLSNNRSVLESMQTQFDKEEVAIKKRLKAVDHIAQNYQAFNTYESFTSFTPGSTLKGSSRRHTV